MSITERSAQCTGNGILIYQSQKCTFVPDQSWKSSNASLAFPEVTHWMCKLGSKVAPGHSHECLCEALQVKENSGEALAAKQSESTQEGSCSCPEDFKASKINHLCTSQQCSTKGNSPPLVHPTLLLLGSQKLPGLTGLASTCSPAACVWQGLVPSASMKQHQLWNDPTQREMSPQPNSSCPEQKK